jgi:hypothetical protein
MEGGGEDDGEEDVAAGEQLIEAHYNRSIAVL